MDGFSFCIFNELGIVNTTDYRFLESCSTPQELLSKVEDIFEKDMNLHHNFSSIKVLYRNNLNSFVPNSLFSEDHLSNYLHFNVQTFSSDYFAYDDVDSISAKNVFIPFININNYLLDHFGKFDYFHHQTIWVEKLMSSYATDRKEVFVYCENNLVDIAVIESDKLLLINSFELTNPESFIYYLLFVYEHLQLDTEQIAVNLFGAISKEMEEYTLAYKYIRHVNLPSSDSDFLTKETDFLPTELFLLT